MSEIKIEREAAIAEILGWAAALGEVYTADEIEVSKTLAAVMAGRVLYDEEKEAFVYSLLKPIDLENGKRVSDVTIEEPTAEYMLRRTVVKVDKGGTGEMDVDTESRFLTAATGLPLGVLQRLKSRDMMVIKELAHFFG